MDIGSADCGKVVGGMVAAGRVEGGCQASDRQAMTRMIVNTQSLRPNGDVVVIK